MALVKELLKPLAEDGAALTREQAAEVLEEILAGKVPEVEIAALLAVLATRGEQAPELAGFVDVCARTPCLAVHRCRTQRSSSTAWAPAAAARRPSTSPRGAALVAAAAGAKVAKHGNRAITSRCGAADVWKPSAFPSSSSRNSPSNACAKPDSSFSSRRSITRP